MKASTLVVKANGSKVTAQLLRKVVGDAGFQVLGAEELGDIAGRAWSESGSIDAVWSRIMDGGSPITPRPSFEGLPIG